MLQPKGIKMEYQEIIQRHPEQWLESDWETVEKEFYEQMSPVMKDIGGFFNPTTESVNENTISFRCFYNNFDNEDEIWYWHINKKTGEIYN